jgi:hypothetical protein
LPWYFGGGTALLCKGHGVSCRCSANGLLGSVVLICGRVVGGGRNGCAVVGVVAGEGFGYAVVEVWLVRNLTQQSFLSLLLMMENVEGVL